eukprot:4957149-Prymnesium_polylepis.1
MRETVGTVVRAAPRELGAPPRDHPPWPQNGIRRTSEWPQKGSREALEGPPNDPKRGLRTASRVASEWPDTGLRIASTSGLQSGLGMGRPHARTPLPRLAGLRGTRGARPPPASERHIWPRGRLLVGRRAPLHPYGRLPPLRPVWQPARPRPAHAHPQQRMCAAIATRCTTSRRTATLPPHHHRPPPSTTVHHRPPPTRRSTTLPPPLPVRTARAAGSFDEHAARWAGVSYEARGVICGLLTMDPKQRTTPPQLLAHRWLAEAKAQPLPESHAVALKAFNRSRRVWREAADAVSFVSVMASPPDLSVRASTRVTSQAADEMRAAFKRYDTDGTGTLDMAELRRAM